MNLLLGEETPHSMWQVPFNKGNVKKGLLLLSVGLTQSELIPLTVTANTCPWLFIVCVGRFSQDRIHTCRTSCTEEWVFQNLLYRDGLWVKELSNCIKRKSMSEKTAACNKDIHDYNPHISLPSTLSLAHWIVCSMVAGKDFKVQNGISSSGGSRYIKTQEWWHHYTSNITFLLLPRLIGMDFIHLSASFMKTSGDVTRGGHMEPQKTRRGKSAPAGAHFYCGFAANVDILRLAF